MKKISILLIALIIISVSLTGCMGRTLANGGGNQGMQRNFQRADLLGQVESIKDNIITVKVAKQPEMRDRQQNDQNATRRPRQVDGNSDNQGNRQQRDGNGPQIGNRPLEFTGDTKNITITESTQINQFRRDDNQSQLKISDIKVGDVISVSFEDKDKGTAARINITNQNSQETKQS